MKKFNLKDIYHEGRPLSWSAISSFEWNPSQWHRKYVLKELPEDTPELIFGKMVDEKLQKDKKYLPHVVRYPTLQHEMRATYNGIPLLGFSDTVDLSLCKLRDFKTGRKEWTQKRVDETGQLTMYLAMLYLMHKIRPEDFELYIDWLPTRVQDGQICFIEENHKKLIPTTFQTKRTMHQVLTFFQRIEDTWRSMEEYCTRQMEMEMDEGDFFGR